MKLRKKLIEVALPLEAINAASAREKSIRNGHPSSLHLWWARRPLAAARAVIFSQMVDDPASHPEEFSTADAQEKERQRLFGLIEELVKWENATNEDVLSQARAEICKSWRTACLDNRDHPRAEELFNPEELPSFHDPFAGGGALPLEAQHLGLEVCASDLNPVAVLINKAMIEIPPIFAGRPPVNPDWQRKSRAEKAAMLWRGADGLAEDVRYYGSWMRDQAEKRIGHLYPKVEVTADMVKCRPDLESLLGQKLTVIACLWARTVKSPNPAFRNVDVPLVSTFILSTKPGKEAYVEPIVENGGFHFAVKVGKPKDEEAARNGTKLSKGSFRCLLSNEPFRYSYIDDEANAGRMGTRLMAIVAEGVRGRTYLPPTAEMEAIARSAEPAWKPDTPSRGTWASNAQGRIYGFRTFGDYFTRRQLVTLTTFSDLVLEARERALQDARASRVPDDGKSLENGGEGASAYADAMAVYLAFAVDRSADFWSNLCIWANQPKNELVVHLFNRQGISMAWDFGETNPFSGSGGNFAKNLDYVVKGMACLGSSRRGTANQFDAASGHSGVADVVVSTDPPYYDNIGYADLSDYFYVWMRRSLRQVFPGLLATVAVPKAEELVASPYRHGGHDKAEAFFLDGMMRALAALARRAHPAFPLTVYYSFKQSEGVGDEGIGNTGWEVFLEALIGSGFELVGTWPVRTERPGGFRNNNQNALASSIVLVCRRHPEGAPVFTRREFMTVLKTELPAALAHLQRSNIAPVDLAQAAIGPGMAIFTRYTKVLDAEGQPLKVRDALALINQILDDVLAEQEGDFDADSRWALSWFEQQGFAEGEYGIAETLCKAKNTSVAGLVEAGFLSSGRGKVRLLKPEELPRDWDPATDERLTVWEMVHHLIRVLNAGGETAAATLARKLGGNAEVARELAYRLYTMCERKKRSLEALAYNALVESWPEIIRLAQEGGEAPALTKRKTKQTEMFD